VSEPAITGEPAAPESASSPSGGPSAAGAALLSERRRQGLSLGDISRQLKLSVRQVEALERDDYSGYKGPVFIHGFLRNYAKLLGLDPEPLIRATDSMLYPPQVPDAAPREPERSRPARTDQSKLRLWPAVLTVLVVGIAMSVYFGGRRAPDAGRSAPPVAARDKPVPSSKIAAEGRTGVETKSKAQPKPEVEAAVKPTTRPDAKPAMKTETKSETETAERRAPVETGGAIAAEPSRRVTVRMIFEQDSWVEIKDRSGNTAFGQLNLAGSRRSVSAEPPLTVVVGNAAGVRLFQGDKSIDLAPHTRVDVARLTLE
jgi:cytoskeleton protein RodZ